MTHRQTLHFLACGHVDDGKSTLMGRLLYDIGVIPTDQVEGARVDGAVDFSRLTDGLEEERAQGITIDVAYRYFRYQGRHYRITDTPGHVQYTRNMAVAAANSDCALVLVDAAHGVREQTVRHSCIAGFFGIRDFVVAVNKMDLADYAEVRFREIEAQYRAVFNAEPQGVRLTFIPVSGLRGDNVLTRSAAMPWYKGPSLMEYLAALEVEPPSVLGARLPIQSVIRIGDTRGYQGMLVDGAMKTGDQIGIAGSDATIRITALYHGGREVDEARPGQAVTLVTDAHADLSRGNVLYSLSAPVLCSDAFAARFLWLDPSYERQESVTGIIKIHHREEQAEVRVRRSDGLMLDAAIYTAASVPVDLYARHRRTGLFLMIDPETEHAIGAGTVTALTDEAPVAQRHAAMF